MMAIALIALAPVVSQTLAGSRMTAAHCAPLSVLAHPSSSAAHDHAHHAATSSGHEHHHADGAGDIPAPEHACGYCELFGHSPVLLDVPWLATLLPAPAFLPLPVPASPARREPSLLAAAPRGPPRAIHA